MFTVDGFGKDTGTGRFPDAPWSAEKKGLCKLVIADGIFQRVRNRLLTNHGVESNRAILAG